MVRISYGPAMLRVLSDVLGVLLAGLLLADLAGGAVRAAGLRFANLPDTRPSSTSLLQLPPLLPRIVPRALTADPDEEVRLKGDADPEQVQVQDKDKEQGQDQAEGALLGTRVRPLGGRRLAATPAPDQQANEIEPRKKHVEDEDDEDDEDDDDEDDEEEEEEEEEEEDDKVDLLKDPGKTFKIKKHKLKKWLLPLLVGYKLKFMTLVPLLFATLALLVASAGFAGFFFAMFTAALTLPKHSSH